MSVVRALVRYELWVNVPIFFFVYGGSGNLCLFCKFGFMTRKFVICNYVNSDQGQNPFH